MSRHQTAGETWEMQPRTTWQIPHLLGHTVEQHEGQRWPPRNGKFTESAIILVNIFDVLRWQKDQTETPEFLRKLRRKQVKISNIKIDIGTTNRSHEKKEGMGTGHKTLGDGFFIGFFGNMHFYCGNNSAATEDYNVHSIELKNNLEKDRYCSELSNK